MTTLAELRIALANAKGDLREAKEDHETMTAIREQRAIDGGATGKNEAERTRALLIALDQDDDYIDSRDRLRAAEYEVDRLTAEIEIIRDARTARELDIRERNNEVLDRLAAAYTAMARVNPVPAVIDGALPF
jgi:hypothetical protein